MTLHRKKSDGTLQPVKGHRKQSDGSLKAVLPGGDTSVAPIPVGDYAPAQTWENYVTDATKWRFNHGNAPQVLTGDHPKWPKMARFTANSTTRASFDPTNVMRTELSSWLNSNGPIAVGATQWWGWSTRFPANLTAPASWLCWTQWHHTGQTCPTPAWLNITAGSNPPRASINLRGGNLNPTGCVSDYNQSHDLGVVPLGVWTDWVVGFTPWHDVNGSGRLTIKRDGVTLLNNISCANMYVGQGMYMKQGIYGDDSGKTVVIDHCGMRRGPTEASIAK